MLCAGHRALVAHPAQLETPTLAAGAGLVWRWRSVRCTRGPRGCCCGHCSARGQHSTRGTAAPWWRVGAALQLAKAPAVHDAPFHVLIWSQLQTHAPGSGIASWAHTRTHVPCTPPPSLAGCRLACILLPAVGTQPYGQSEHGRQPVSGSLLATLFVSSQVLQPILLGLGLRVGLVWHVLLQTLCSARLITLHMAPLCRAPDGLVSARLAQAVVYKARSDHMARRGPGLLLCPARRLCRIKPSTHPTALYPAPSAAEPRGSPRTRGAGADPHAVGNAAAAAATAAPSPNSL